MLKKRGRLIIKERNYLIKLTEDELIKYYANKIIEDGLDETQEFNYIIYFKEYEHSDFINKHQKEILKYLKRDQRVTDVYIDANSSFNMVFGIDYCPYYYEEDIADELTEDEEIRLFKKFKKHIKEQIKNTRKEDFYTSTRILVKDFIKDLKEKNKEPFYHRITQVIAESGFNEKYIDKYEILVDLDNINELENILNTYIRNLMEEKETEESW